MLNYWIWHKAPLNNEFTIQVEPCYDRDVDLILPDDTDSESRQHITIVGRVPGIDYLKIKGTGTLKMPIPARPLNQLIVQCR